MLDLMRRTLGANIQIDTMLAADLKQTLVDPDQLESALLNLAINALATPCREVASSRWKPATFNSTRITPRPNKTCGPARMSQLAVRDNGGGMAPEVLEHAFEPFTTRKPAKAAAWAQHGLWPGQTVRRPYRDSQPISVRAPRYGFICKMQVAASPPVGVKAADTVLGHGETILVVEDDTDVRLFAVNALACLGYDT